MKRTLKTFALFTALAAATALTPPLAAVAAETAPHYTLVDGQGRTVARLVTEPAGRENLALVGHTAARLPVLQAAEIFHPDFSHAVTPAQLNAAWNAEVNRLMPVPLNGGGA